MKVPCLWYAKATRQHLGGLIAVCNGDSQGAIQALESAETSIRQGISLAGFGAGADGERGCVRGKASIRCGYVTDAGRYCGGG